MRTPGEWLGLMAYLFVMYGGVPDREVIDAAFEEGFGGGGGQGTGRGHLKVVGGTATAQGKRTSPRRAAGRTERAA